MTGDLPDEEALLRRAKAGDQRAAAELFERYRDRLRQMVRLRLDRRLAGRLDASDVLQEAYLDYARRLPEYAARPTVPFYLWLRGLTGQRLIDLHRQHLGAQMRDAGQEVSLYRGALPPASSVHLASRLLGRLTSPTHAAMRAELQLRLQEALNSLDPLDREVVVLRQFEGLSNGETAEVLGIQKAAASKRYVRALTRLKKRWRNEGSSPGASRFGIILPPFLRLSSIASPAFSIETRQSTARREPGVADPNSERDPVDQLAEEFLQRWRRGERPPLTEYVVRYPEYAEAIQAVFPALIKLEKLKPAPSDLTRPGS